MRRQIFLLKKKTAGYEKSLPILFALMLAIRKHLQKKSREGVKLHLI